METKTRLTRFDTSQPIVRNGKIVDVMLTEHEEQQRIPILDARFDRYPWPMTCCPATTSGRSCRTGAGIPAQAPPQLTHEPNNYLRLPPEMPPPNAKAGSRSLTNAHADTVFIEDEFWHDLMANMIAAQYESGVRQRPDLQIANFSRIINAPEMPVDGSRTWTVEIPRPTSKTAAAIWYQRGRARHA